MGGAGPLSKRMGGQIALLKYHATRTCWQIADDTVQAPLWPADVALCLRSLAVLCVQIMGGRGITKTGMGSSLPPPASW